MTAVQFKICKQRVYHHDKISRLQMQLTDKQFLFHIKKRNRCLPCVCAVDLQTGKFQADFIMV